MSKAKALVAARDQGLDITPLGDDAAGDEVSATLSEDVKLARAMASAAPPAMSSATKWVSGRSGSPL